MLIPNLGFAREEKKYGGGLATLSLARLCLSELPSDGAGC